MKCPRCGTDNELGTIYCTGCGGRLEITDSEAQAQAVAAVRHENWQKAFKSLNRTLFFFALVFVGALLFNSYARREIIADFSPVAPLPPASPLALSPSFIDEPSLPIPPVTPAPAIEADNVSHARILADLAGRARGRLACTVRLKTGGIVRGVLLSRGPDKIEVITDWGPPIRTRVIETRDIDLPRSQLPD